MKLALSLFFSAANGQDLFLAPTPSASEIDLRRAHTRVQSAHLGGYVAQDIAEKINRHLDHVGVPTQACDSLSLLELNDMVRSMWPYLSFELEDIYKVNQDLRSKRFATLSDYEDSWAADMEHDVTTLRHAKCHEVVMLWAHHLSETAKKFWKAKLLPALPSFDAKKAENKVYAASTTCQTGHKMVAGSGSSTHKWPDWPEELHYSARAHGAYPFWWGGGSDSASADMEVWWSEKQGAEKFAHTACTGQSSWLNGPCVHLMLAPGSNITSRSSKPQSYLYTKDESKCCISEPSASSTLKFPPSGGVETLAPSQGTFWKEFTYKGEVDFNGVHYQGKAKYYLLSGVNEPVTDFWYFTDLDGKPVQQGEAGTGPTDQGYPVSIGHTIWHDYDQSTFDTSAIDPSVFAIPSACKTTTLSCAFP